MKINGVISFESHCNLERLFQQGEPLGDLTIIKYVQILKFHQIEAGFEKAMVATKALSDRDK